METIVKEKNSKFEILYITSLVISFIYLIVQPILHNPSLTGLVWKAGIVILFISSVFATEFTLSKGRLFGFTSLIFVMGIGLLFSSEPITSNLIFSCVAFLCMLLELYFFGNATVSKNLFDIIYKFAIALTLLFFAYTFTSIGHTYLLDGVYTTSIYLVYNLDNSNTAGIYLYILFCIILINLPKRQNKFLNIMLLCMDFYMIYGTNCRSALFAAMGVLALSLLSFAKKMPKIFIVLAWLFPILFVSMYMGLYESGYENIQIFGKSLFSGRQRTFKIYLNVLTEKWHYWFGNLGLSQLQNAHNAPLAFYTSLGIVGAAITELMLLFSTFTVNKTTKNSFLAVASIMGVFVSSSAEASMFLGGFPGVVLLSSLFILANYE